tara:strand:- start:46 stop:312 length:267 start_codon:yes stop_codon:yes gene_type:complete
MDEHEEKEGFNWGDFFGHSVRFLILVWSLSMMTLGYMGRVRIDGAFTAGLVSGVLGSYGISVGNKKNGQINKDKLKINPNNNNNVGIK